MEELVDLAKAEGVAVAFQEFAAAALHGESEKAGKASTIELAHLATRLSEELDPAAAEESRQLAIAFLRGEQDRHPGDAMLYYLEGRFHEQSGRRAYAEEAYALALRARPGHRPSQERIDAIHASYRAEDQALADARAYEERLSRERAEGLRD